MNKALEPKRLLFHLILGIIMIFILYRCSGDYTDVFEVGNEHYILKIVKEKEYDGLSRTTDIFSYEKKENNEELKIGCGTLVSVGYDQNKEYFYGESEYGINDEEYGIYTKGKEVKNNRIHQNREQEISKKEISENEMNDNIEFLKNQCTGYFVLNLKTGEYQSGLSEKEQEDILLDKGIEINLMSVKKFIKKYGKSIRNYQGLEDWMSI